MFGVNLSSGQQGKYKGEREEIFQSEGFINRLFEAAEELDSDTEEGQKLVKAELKSLYHSIHNSDKGYLGKLILGYQTNVSLTIKINI